MNTPRRPRSPVATPLIVTAAIIGDGDGRILIAQRPEGDSLAGKWEFPGGKLEPGEDPRDGLARECREELGIEVTVGRIFETIFHSTPDRDILLLFYEVAVQSGEPSPLEGHTLVWVTPPEMRDYDWLPADWPVIEMIIAHPPF